METIEEYIEFCLIRYQDSGYLKWNFKNYQLLNSNILYKGSYDLLESYIKNEFIQDIKSFEDVMKMYNAQLNYSLVDNELYIEIKKIELFKTDKQNYE